MTDIRLSVVTPSFNQGQFIQRTLRSVLDQDIEDLELLVIDGGSSDGTVDILRAYSDRCSWISEPDRGQANAINKGLALARGEVIGWLNSDDVYRPGALQAVLSFFDTHPEVDLVYGDADFIDQDDAVIGPYYTEPWNVERLYEVCFICQPAAFFRRSVVERFGPLDETLHFCLDYEYWLRLAHARARVAYLQRCLAASRLYATTKTLGSRLRFHTEINAMLRTKLGYVPDRWLTNEAHTRLDLRGKAYDREPLRFAVEVSILSCYLALKWNRRVSPSLMATTRTWVLGALQHPAESTGGRAGRRIRRALLRALGV